MGKLQEALSLMEETFSSNEFINKAILLGYETTKEKKVFINTFLRLNCTQLNTCRMWAKKEVAKPLIFSESSCIKYLKDKGFKIYKPVVEFKEV